MDIKENDNFVSKEIIEEKIHNLELLQHQKGLTQREKGIYDLCINEFNSLLEIKKQKLEKIEQLKLDYNTNLKRYKNGCKYLEENPEQWDLYIEEIFNILENINKILAQILIYEKPDKKEILEGFEL